MKTTHTPGPRKLETVTTMKNKTKFLLVTTAHRGVFAGYGVPTNGKTIRLTEARMCVYWSSDMRGVMGLAAKGPSQHCRIGFAVPALVLQDVTSITEISLEAEDAWKQQPWH